MFPGLMAEPAGSKKFYPGGFDTQMTVHEALLVLEIKDFRRLTETDLKKRHRSIMIQNHPDRGGSPYIAMKINEARDILEASKNFK